jgi:hypothetical protein
MRMLGAFFGAPAKRNDPIKLEDPHPVHRLERRLDTGNAGLDGYTVLARAQPGSPSPPVKGQEGRAYMGPNEDWEQ